MLGVSAEFETNLRRERQLEGTETAKARGIYKDRKPSRLMSDSGVLVRPPWCVGGAHPHRQPSMCRRSPALPISISTVASIGRGSVQHAGIRPK